MNPPSALYGAMNKERKPFTYTPGGLDLSEIKSERMAKRLMRNAMSQGVPETPVQTIQSPPVAAGTIPNFNCLPVQVFPSFQLPANPKSLLRTRSNTDAPKEPPSNNIPPPITVNHSNDSWREINKPSPEYSNNNIGSNYIPASIYDYKPITDSHITKSKYGSYDHTDILLPEKSYDATYFQLEPQGAIKEIKSSNTSFEENIQKHKNPDVYSDVLLRNAIDNEMNPVHLTSLQDIAPNNYEQKEVKIVKKQTKTKNETDQNGDTEAEVTVKLPTKASAAKTETKVEVLKKILPDGTIEEVKKTITKTTIDGKTEISTKTETRTIPKESSEDVEEFEEEEEETENVVVEENEEDGVVSNKNLESKVTESLENWDEVEQNDEKVNETIKVTENGQIINGEEKSETSTTKKVVVIQSTGEESEEEVEEEVEEEEEEETGDVDVEEVVIIKKPPNKENESEKDNTPTEDNVETSKKVDADEQEVDEQEADEQEADELEAEEQEADEQEALVQEKEIEQEEDIQEEEEEEKQALIQQTENEEKDASDVEEQDVDDKVEQKDIENITSEDNITNEQHEEVEESYEEVKDSKIEEQAQEDKSPVKTVEIDVSIESKVEEENKTVDNIVSSQEAVTIPIENKEEKDKQEINVEILLEKSAHSEPRVSFREPSIPLERVEDIEIKPIGPAQEIIKKSHTEIITTTTDKPSGALSTQTEYNRIENFVTVNRTTKTLDHAYEQTQQSIPTLKTYFSPINDRVLSTPQPVSKPFQPVYTPEPQTERRHSLLLDRLSVDRQIPTADIYQNNYQSNQVYEQNQWSEEPQSEVLTVSNVKPSTITKNQQWYQQTKKENYVSNAISPTPVLPSQIWNQQNQAQSQNQLPTQQQYQTFSQQAYTPKPEYQSTYVENTAQNVYKSNTNNLQQNTYPSYTPKPSWVSSTFDSKPVSSVPNQYSSLKNESTESYQKSTQQFNSSYVPPPWEQDSSYIPESQNYYQPPPASYTPTTNQTWKPKPPPSKFSKSAPTSYIPPAPNQSFVKPVAPEDSSKISGRKTYYSEYERRYISVPESTYIPNENKFSAQPDPSPQYYYDNNEPAELVEPQWRKELREFTEKTQTSTQTEKTSVRPPWEEDPKYAAPTEYSTTATPSWTQTLRPRSWRERSYEPEYIGSKEWPKTNTLGRGRPQSSYVKSNVNTIPERTRGVSVDRYNPNNYQSPLTSEHPPVQSHTLNPTIHPKTYHNPTVPAYHTRASAEPREQVTAYPQQRIRVDTRAPPVQSRSFKYLQWITGTED